MKEFGLTEGPITPPASAGPQDRETMDQEKRLRREIANSNERRRMQSINAGFQGLRNLLPHHEGEKLSKAAILQQTAEYIHQLEQEKARLMTQNSQLMKRFNNGSSSTAGTSGSEGGAGQSVVFSSPHSPAGEAPTAIIKRRKTLDGSVESADEGIGSMSPDHNGEEYRNEVAELRRETLGLRTQLERERRHRLSLEDMMSTLRHQNASQQQVEEQRVIVKREIVDEEQRHHHHHQQQQQMMEQQIVYVQQPQQPQAPPQPVHVKYEERMQTAEEGEVHLRVPTPVRNPYDDYRVRHNLNSIVEAIRQLEGDHLFADDRPPSTRSSLSPPSASPRAMEVCSSNSPSHNRAYTVAVATTSSTQPTTLTYHCSEVPLALTSPANNNHPSSVHHEHGHSGAGVMTVSSRPVYQPPPSSVIPVSVPSTVTSLKHHVLNRLARSGEMDEPINLEYRPVSRTPSPPPSHCLQQQHHPLHLAAPQQTHSSPSVAQFHLQQQQLRPGVIVVKHS